MIKKVEHIGIAVKDLDASNTLFSKLLGIDHYKMEQVESQHVMTSFFRSGETKIELLAATKPESVINRFIEKKGEGIHHIAFLVDDIHKEIIRLKEDGFQALMEKPEKGADNKLVFFFHPKSTNGVLVEICQEI